MCLNEVVPVVSRSSAECGQVPSLYHWHAIFLIDPLPGVAEDGCGDMVVEPANTAD